MGKRAKVNIYELEDITAELNRYTEYSRVILANILNEHFGSRNATYREYMLKQHETMTNMAYDQMILMQESIKKLHEIVENGISSKNMEDNVHEQHASI